LLVKFTRFLRLVQVGCISRISGRVFEGGTQNIIRTRILR